MHSFFLMNENQKKKKLQALMAVYSVNLSILERVFKETFTEEVKSQHFVAAVVTYNNLASSCMKWTKMVNLR